MLRMTVLALALAFVLASIAQARPMPGPTTYHAKHVLYPHLRT